MRAAVLFGKEDMRVTAWAEPQLGRGDVLVRVTRCGVCGSDLRTFFVGPSPRYRLPAILGHEFVGTVEKLGDGVTAFMLGDRVAAAPAVPCGECFYCKRGEDNLCRNMLDFGINLDGAFAELIRIPANLVARGGLVKVSDALSDADAIWGEPIGTVLHGELRAKTGVGQTVVVVGDGPIAMLHTLVAKYLGAARVCLLGQQDYRMPLARSVGADVATLNAREIPEHQADVVIVAVSDTTALDGAFAFVRDGGTVVAFGGTARESRVSLPLYQLHYGEINFIGSFNCTAEDFRRALEMIPRLNLKPLAPRVVTLEKIVDGFRTAYDREVIKVVAQIA
jgi:L-iditol 2-dehydrogenase